MRLATRPGRVTAWIAIFAILLAALAPSLARALAPPQQAMPWGEICTAAGMQQVAVDAAPDSGSHEGSGPRHCPYCLVHAGHFALPSATGSFCPATATGAAAPLPFFVAPPPRLIRPAAAPRAPPSIS